MSASHIAPLFRGAACLATLLLVPALVHGQAAPVRDQTSVDERLCYFAIDADGRPGASLIGVPLQALTDPLGGNAFAFLYYALPGRGVEEARRGFLRLAERARVDEQIGSSALGGSTTAASRTGLASVLAMALETGAVTQTLDENLLTLRANADGLVRFLSNQQVFPPCSGEIAGQIPSEFLKNLELSASFNVSESDTETLSGVVPGTSDTAQFSSTISTRQLRVATARYAIYNARDLRSREYAKRWADWVGENVSALRPAARPLLQQFQELTGPVRTQLVAGRPADDEITYYALWREGANKALAVAAQTEQERRRVYAEQLDALIATMRKLDPEFDVKLEGLANAYAVYLSTRQSLAAALVTDPALTVEYNYAQPALQPRLHTLRVAYAYSPKRSDGRANPGTITFNAALGYHDCPQPIGDGLDTARWRDVQLALQFDRPVGPADSAAQLSLGVYYQYQPNPGIIEIPEGATSLPGTSIPLPPSGTKLLTESGALWVGQGVLTIRIPGSGVKMPIGFSWSNRTELASGNEVRGNVGFTFDPASLFLLGD